MNNLFALDLAGQEVQAQPRMLVQPNAIRAVVDGERYFAKVEQRFATLRQAVATLQNRRTMEQPSGDASVTFAPLSGPDFTEVKRHLAEPAQTIVKRRIHEHDLGFMPAFRQFSAMLSFLPVDFHSGGRFRSSVPRVSRGGNVGASAGRELRLVIAKVAVE